VVSTDLLASAFLAAYPRAEAPLVDRVKPVATGEHDEVTRLRLRWREPQGPGEADLVVRTATDDEGKAACLRESRALRLAGAEDLAVPTLWLAGGGDDPGLVLADWIEGERFSGAWRRRAPIATAELLAEVLVELHERTEDRPASTAAGVVGDVLARLRRLAEEAEDDAAEAELEALTQARPKAVKAALCHGDFRADKVLIERAKRAVLVGWTHGGYGDPRLDLARAVVALDAEEGGVLRAPFLKAYRRTRPVEPSDLEWFEALVKLERRLEDACRSS
jgi:aminoglycoside phosphotransferase (APT) family kinase protein